jgi:hypothetical protein
MVDEATLQAQLPSSTRISRRLAAGVIKEYPDGRREAVALNAPGDERVLRTLPPLPREPA